MVAAVAHIYLVVSTDGKIVRVLKLADIATETAKLARKYAVRLKHLNSVVFFVTYVDEAHAVTGYAPGVVHLAVPSSLLAKLKLEVAVVVKHLHAVVVAVSDQDVTHRVECNSSQAIKLPISLTVRSKRFYESSDIVENLNPMVTAISHIHLISARNCNPSRPDKLTRITSPGTEPDDCSPLVLVVVGWHIDSGAFPAIHSSYSVSDLCILTICPAINPDIKPHWFPTTRSINRVSCAGSRHTVFFSYSLELLPRVSPTSDQWGPFFFF